MNVVDRYEIRARLLPALVCTLPLLSAILLCLPDARGLATSASMAVVFGMLAPLAADLVRARGKSIENKLRKRSSRVALLSWEDSSLPVPLKTELHTALQRRFSKVALPNAEFERRNKAEAEEAYETVLAMLFPDYRDAKRYPLVHSELTTYGFRRNLFGLRPVAMGCSLAGAALGLSFAVFEPQGAANVATSLVAFSACIAGAVLFWYALTPQWVAHAEREYIRQLLLAVLSDSRSGNTRRSKSK